MAKADSDSKTAAGLIRPGSKIEGLENVGKDFYVWSTHGPAVKADQDLLFALCQVLPGSDEKTLKLKQVQPQPSDAVSQKRGGAEEKQTERKRRASRVMGGRKRV